MGPGIVPKRVPNVWKRLPKQEQKTGAEKGPEAGPERTPKWDQNGTNREHFGARFAGIAGPVLGTPLDAFCRKNVCLAGGTPSSRPAGGPFAARLGPRFGARFGTFSDPFPGPMSGRRNDSGTGPGITSN